MPHVLIEIPCAVPVLDDGNRHGPVFCPNIESYALVGLDNHAMHLIVAADEATMPLMSMLSFLKLRYQRQEFILLKWTTIFFVAF